MSRLNKTIRQGIIANALKSAGVITRNDALIKRRAKLADDCRIFELGGVEKMEADAKAFAKIEKLAKGMTGYKYIEHICANPRSKIYANFAGMRIELHYNGFEYSTRGDDHVVKSPSTYDATITADNPLNTEFKLIEKEQKIISDLRTQVEAEVGAVVHSVGSIKKLLQVWPEAVALLPDAEKPQSTELVADVTRLNTILELPKDAQ